VAKLLYYAAGALVLAGTTNSSSAFRTFLVERPEPKPSFSYVRSALVNDFDLSSRCRPRYCSAAAGLLSSTATCKLPPATCRIMANPPFGRPRAKSPVLFALTTTRTTTTTVDDRWICSYRCRQSASVLSRRRSFVVGDASGLGPGTVRSGKRNPEPIATGSSINGIRERHK
jgi:hypothetical protein